MKRFVRNICIVLIFVILVQPIVHASENIDTRGSDFFGRHITFIERVTTRQFEVWFSVVAVTSMDELGVCSITVQRSSDGTNWTNMKTFEKEDYPNMICNNTVAHSGCVTYWGTPGYYYRAAVCYYAKNGSSIGEYDTYSDIILL